VSRPVRPPSGRGARRRARVDARHSALDSTIRSPARTLRPPESCARGPVPLRLSLASRCRGSRRTAGRARGQSSHVAVAPRTSHGTPVSAAAACRTAAPPALAQSQTRSQSSAPKTIERRQRTVPRSTESRCTLCSQDGGTRSIDGHHRRRSTASLRDAATHVRTPKWRRSAQRQQRGGQVPLTFTHTA
jgi:hypothetical protein